MDATVILLSFHLCVIVVVMESKTIDINRKTINSRRWRKEGYDPRGDGKTRNTFGNQYGLLSIEICDFKFLQPICVSIFIILMFG